jgi:NDP-sugar pyrophosphorylase family protein
VHLAPEPGWQDHRVMIGSDSLVGLVLAAGAGTRLRPLTDELPKALCPVGNVPLVDHALAKVEPYVGAVAVNVHASQPLLRAHVEGRAHVSMEAHERLATAGAVGHLRDWIAGRHVLLHNADSFHDDDLSALLEGWTGEHPRLLVRTETHPSDFAHLRFLGVSLLPAHLAAQMPDRVAGLSTLVWGPAWDAGTLETVEARGAAVDCGTPSDYLRANLHVSGGESVVGDGAVVGGSITRCVVWPGARVERGEVLVESIRTPLHTVGAPLG